MSGTVSSGKLQKAHILVHDKNGKIQYNDPIEVLFNPSQYSIVKANQFASLPVPGKESPLIQFIRGEAETLTLELFFDTFTYFKGKDVRDFTNRMKSLQKIDDETHAPPICSFIWGKAGKDKPFFTGVVENLTATYTMFLYDGTPVRAKLNLSIKQYPSNEKPGGSLLNDIKNKLVFEGESLWMIAAIELGDAGKWKLLADVNNISDPLELEVGLNLVVPKVDFKFEL